MEHRVSLIDMEIYFTLLLVYVVVLIHGGGNSFTASYCNCCSSLNQTAPNDFNTSLSDSSVCLLNSSDFIYQFCESLDNAFLNMSWKNIKEFNEFGCSWQNISVVDLSHNELDLLQKNAFLDNNTITQLFLAANNIYQIQTDAFSNLGSLELLDLSENKLQGIQSNAFYGLINMKHLNLSRNQIRFVSPGNFFHLTRLKILDLSSNRIESFDKTTFMELRNLKVLHLEDNNLTDNKFGYLSVFANLLFLDISRNTFTSIEERSFYRYNITNINLSKSLRLKYILQNAFVDMPYLKDIDISDSLNLFFIHEKAFSNVHRLHSLNITNTNVRFLPTVEKDTVINIRGIQLLCSCYDDDVLRHTYVTSDEMCTTKGESTPISSVTVIPCPSVMISNGPGEYSLSLGQSLNINCFAVGYPWPVVRWERAISNENGVSYETVVDGYFLNLHIKSLNDEGMYRCVAETNDSHSIKDVNIKVLRIDIGIRVLTCDATSVVITWNRTHHVTRHVILYRAFEINPIYTVQQLNEYWKLFRIDSLTPSTEYEVCIASKLDINDKNCVRISTITEVDVIPGIRHDSGVIAVLTISGFVFGLVVLATLYRCVRKLQIITKQHVFIVSSESREAFGDVTEATFTYENQFSDFLLENEDKTEF